MRALLTIEHRGAPPRTQVVAMGETYILGRGRDATLRIDDERISRKHVSVALVPTGIEVTELGSRNGTFLNGRLLQSNEKLNTGRFAVIDLGDAHVTVEIEQEGAESPRTKRLDAALTDLTDDFEVLGEIGAGASGKVYVARQRRMNKTVAVKSLKSHVATNPKSRERFLREGKLASRIHSPNVVQVYDVRVTEEHAYIIMELVQGPSAKDRLATGPLSLAEGLSVGEDIANALDAAAEAKVVHRDVKPGNILIDVDGVAKLVDFGIAKDLESSKIQSLTVTGDGLGTIAYVSPEQAQDAKAVDYRTDIYGLGATLYHLLAGRPPFPANSPRVLLDILEKPAPPLTAYRVDAPQELEDLLAAMLEKDPARRPQTAKEVAHRIREIRLHLGLVRSAGADETFDGSTTDQGFPVPRLGDDPTG